MRWLLPVLAAAGCTEVREDITPHATLQGQATHATVSRTLPPPVLRDPTDRPDIAVYGYWPYWGDPLATVPFDQLTHIALFSVGLNSDGGLNSQQNWNNHVAEAMSLAAPHGVRVHLTLTSFSDSVNNTVLPNPTLRARAVSELAALVNGAGAHGVNIDIEGMDAARRADLVAFTTELAAAVDEVWLALPPIDWSRAYDYGALGQIADGLFIMGYNYHWAGGGPGPIAPLFGVSPWSQYSLAWSVEDYRSHGVPDHKITLGMPLYGYDWPTTSTSVPGTRTGDASARFYADAVATAASRGRSYDSATESPYTFPSSTRQLWYEDAQSIEAKVAWAVAEQLQGVGFWALTYDDADPDLWGRIDALTHDESLDVDPATVRIIDSDNTANEPDLAYVDASADWTRSTSTPGFWGSDYLAGPSNTVASDPATFHFNNLAPACYTVQAWWTAGSNRATSASWNIHDADGTRVGTVTTDQTGSGARWNTLGTWAFGIGWSRVSLSRWVSAGSWSIADAVRLVPSPTCPGFDVDADGDGTVDGADLCPADPGKQVPGDCGCGTPDLDLNGDGQSDCGHCGDGTVDPGEVCDDGNLIGGDGCSASCAVEALVLSPMTPGIAGVSNQLDVRGGAPSGDVFLLASRSAGATPVPGCPGMMLPLRRPTLVETLASDAQGHAIWTATVPSSFAGRTFLFYAVELDTCRVSNLGVGAF